MPRKAVAEAAVAALETTIAATVVTTPPRIASQWNQGNGGLAVNLALPGYTSQGQLRQIRFVYQSRRAKPFPLLSISSTILSLSAVPWHVRFRFTSISGLSSSEEVFVDTQGLDETRDDSFALAAGFDASGFGTGVLDVEIEAAAVFGDSYRSSRSKTDIVVVNESASPFGAGWGLAGMERLHRVVPQGKGFLYVDGAGDQRIYNPVDPTMDVPDRYISPDGDSASLSQRPDGTVVRRLKDGTVSNFGVDGFVQSVVDSNGNTTSLAYDSGRLVGMTDPVGRQTTFVLFGRASQLGARPGRAREPLRPRRGRKPHAGDVPRQLDA